MNLVKNIIFWIKAARGYSFPMSVMSWSVPFLFGAIEGGNILYGIIALFGIVLAHAGVNLFDDFIDFNLAKRQNTKVENYGLQKGKCAYLMDKSASTRQLFAVICLCFATALTCGIFLAVKTGMPVIYLTLISAAICILYPLFSFVALGEFAVAVMFAPLLYTGVYYVMKQSFSTDLMIIAVSTGLLTVGLLHAHMFLDIDYDKNNSKNTLCRLAGSKISAARNQLLIMLIAYLNIVFFTFINSKLSKMYLITLFSLPTAIILFKIMVQSIKEPEKKIHTNIFFGILENLQEYKEKGNLNFMITFMTARNVMVEFTALICLAKILEEIKNVYF